MVHDLKYDLKSDLQVLEVAEVMLEAIIEVNEFPNVLKASHLNAVLTVLDNGFHDLKYDLKSDLNDLHCIQILFRTCT